MNRRGPVLVVVLLIAVLGLGGVLLARGRPSATAPAAAGVVIYGPCGMTSPITTAAAKSIIKSLRMRPFYTQSWRVRSST